MNVADVRAVLASQPAGTFLEIAAFNGSNVGACDITGVSPVWEMHPDTDELFYILEGEFEVTLWRGEAAEEFVAPAGSLFVVPKGVWHKPAAPNGAKFVYLTPGKSLHSQADDPRTAGDGVLEDQ